ncbi:N-acetylmannosamine-6-phosphate 2-epimerase [Robertmurraya korlensis]|uniref:N-acetylmannosamine-6-phosphate 2-epimerase n=1 Tax=Robertmurraya korlensis TaxID=519977 RepID=UPI002041B536|nr:N-acetylmannosamine-6-phosphate 2-epimerase [Robertmurraya korlensis]MCM3601711.1 N-acetylmannosamine-6-phosphate 2-epimerase [Robertmurraya korlensis]
MLSEIKKGLIVSCQALEGEPLYGSNIMKRMADAAKRGGAIGIRANGVADIKVIKEYVKLPIIGIIKREYNDSNVYITPTLKEVEELVEVGVDIIATDATNRIRPGAIDLALFMKEANRHFPEQKWMADCSTFEECLNAQELGFDYVGTTMHGYTESTKGKKLYHDDFQFLKDVASAVKVPIIAEGNILTPEMASKALEYGAYSVVVGGAITRPQQITERFVEEMNRSRTSI